MKKRRGEQQEMRDRRRKQFLRRIQEQEWKQEQRQIGAADEKSYSPDQANHDENRDSA